MTWGIRLAARQPRGPGITRDPPNWIIINLGLEWTRPWPCTLIKFGKRRMYPFYTNYIVVGMIRPFSNKKNKKAPGPGTCRCSLPLTVATYLEKGRLVRGGSQHPIAGINQLGCSFKRWLKTSGTSFQDWVCSCPEKDSLSHSDHASSKTRTGTSTSQRG